MATIVPSRFAVLSFDDDDDSSPRKKKNPTKKPPAKAQTSVKSDGSGKKKKKQDNAPQPHSQKNNNNKGNTNKANTNKGSTNKGNTKKKKQATREQWEEWKQKDTEFVEGNFEEDLSKAILLSKLDYEQKKNSSKVNEENKKITKKSKKDQKVFPAEEPKNLGSQSRKNESLEAKTEDQELMMDEHLLRLNINRQDLLSLISYKALIEKKDAENARLKGEIEALSIQLKNVKTRNTKLCQIIANGEMKDKAEVLMEVERLQTIKDELSSEVATLHRQLEQERSKNRQLTAELKTKDKSKRHHMSSEVQ